MEYYVCALCVPGVEVGGAGVCVCMLTRVYSIDWLLGTCTSTTDCTEIYV